MLFWPFLVAGGALGVIIGGLVDAARREGRETKRDTRTRLIFQEELKKDRDERAKTRATKSKADPPPKREETPPAKKEEKPPAAFDGEGGEGEKGAKAA